MSNNDITIARRYHEATKHSYWSVRSGEHFLDWASQPSPFKVYPDLEPILLARDVAHTGVPALQAICSRPMNAGFNKEAIPTLSQLTHLLFHSAGITKVKSHGGDEISFRAAACAGALYPIEVYLVCGDLPDLQAGVYHFSPADFGLRRLRSGDYRSWLAQATADEPSIASAPVVFVYTAMTWRSSWKYQARSYRYHYWDCGMIAANAMAALTANHLPHKLVMGFADDEVNRLIGVDGEHEMALALVTVGQCETRLPKSKQLHSLPVLTFNYVPLSHAEVEYPIIGEAHAGSQLAGLEEVEDWRSGSLQLPDREPEGTVFPLQPIDEQLLPTESLESVIVRRGSTRRFAHKPLTYGQFSTLLGCAQSECPSDFLPSGARLNDLYINVHAVEGLPAGAYFFHRGAQAVELLMKANFRGNSSYLCLEQDLGGDSSATVFFLADLNPILARYGNRGYRVVQMEAAISGGRMYLAAYALGRGATGLTFYDDDVIEFFSPHSAGKSAIFVMALGVPGRRPIV
jgi:SagB-type dehydrogenase family enzyme